MKYRRSVLSAEIEAYLKELFQEIAQEKEFEVVMMEVGEKEHLHVFASAHPKIAPSEEAIKKYIENQKKGEG